MAALYFYLLFLLNVVPNYEVIPLISFDFHGWDCRVAHAPRNDREVALLLKSSLRGEAVAISTLDDIDFWWLITNSARIARYKPALRFQR